MIPLAVSSGSCMVGVSIFWRMAMGVVRRLLACVFLVAIISDVYRSLVRSSRLNV
jgi:hypothetical protein